MRLDELMEIIEIDSLDEFEFFEHFSALMECPEEIDYDLFGRVLFDVETPLLTELTDNFFEDLIQGVPDDAMTLYSLLYNVKTALCEAAKESDTKQDRLFYIENLYRFRDWYIFDSFVRCRRISDDLISETSIFDALTLFRLEKLGEDKYDYDFTQSLEFLMDERIAPIEADEFDDESYGEEFDESLIDEEYPVIEDENSAITEEDDHY
jgi:hypothetical protein